MANNAFVYIEKTLPKVVDKIFTVKSQTERLLGASDVKLSFMDAKTIKIFKVKFFNFVITISSNKVIFNYIIHKSSVYTKYIITNID